MKQKSHTHADASGQYTAFGEDYFIIEMTGGLLDYPNTHRPIEVENPSGIFIEQSYSGNGGGNAESYVVQLANYGIKANIEELDGKKGVLVKLDENPGLAEKVREAHVGKAITRALRDVANSYRPSKMRSVNFEHVCRSMVKALGDVGISTKAQTALFEKAIRSAQSTERG